MGRDMKSTGVTLGDPDESLVLSVPPQAFGCPPCCSSLAESRAATAPPLCRGVGEEEQRMLLPSPAAKVAEAGGPAADSLARDDSSQAAGRSSRRARAASAGPGCLAQRQPITLASSPWLNPCACSSWMQPSSIHTRELPASPPLSHHLPCGGRGVPGRMGGCSSRPAWRSPMAACGGARVGGAAGSAAAGR